MLGLVLPPKQDEKFTLQDFVALGIVAVEIFLICYVLSWKI